MDLDGELVFVICERVLNQRSRILSHVDPCTITIFPLPNYTFAAIGFQLPHGQRVQSAYMPSTHGTGNTPASKDVSVLAQKLNQIYLSQNGYVPKESLFSEIQRESIFGGLKRIYFLRSQTNVFSDIPNEIMIWDPTQVYFLRRKTNFFSEIQREFVFRDPKRNCFIPQTKRSCGGVLTCSLVISHGFQDFLSWPTCLDLPWLA